MTALELAEILQGMTLPRGYNNGVLDDAAAELRRLADLERDAARYRWLKEYYSPECQGRYMTDIDRGWYGDGSELDEAIDAAMGGAK